MSGAPPEAPPPDGPGEKPTIEEACKRILALDDEDGDLVHAIAFFGEDDWHWYYIVVLSREFEGNEFLNERYVQLVKPAAREEGRDDTYKKNGINRRVSDRRVTSAAVLGRLYQTVATREDAYRDGRLDPDDMGVCYFDAVEGNVEPEEQ